MPPNAVFIWRYAIVFLSFLSIALAAAPTSFCKCTCFSNSTIIPLNDGTSSSLKSNSFFQTSASSSSTSPSDKDNGKGKGDQKAPAKRSCNDCNKQFCLNYNLPICQNAEEENVITMCFQRDSRKDQAVIYLFIAATMGLLGWAAIKPWWEKWRESKQSVGRGAAYAPVHNGEGEGQGAHNQDEWGR